MQICKDSTDASVKKYPQSHLWEFLPGESASFWLAKVWESIVIWNTLKTSLLLHFTDATCYQWYV